MLANGGKRIKPTLIDRIQDRWGDTIYRHDERTCEGCDAQILDRTRPEPKLVDKRQQVLDPLTAYQVTSILEGVITRGTGFRPSRNSTGTIWPARRGPRTTPRTCGSSVIRPISTVGLYLGYDQPRSLGATAYRGPICGPGVPRVHAHAALKDKPDVPFRAPLNIKLIGVDYRTGMRSNGKDAIIEAFKPGTAPPDSYSVIDGSAGRTASRGESSAPAAPAERSASDGTGGLY